MKHRFNKEELPFLNETFKNEKPRNYFWLGRKLEEGKSFTPDKELALYAYEKGANMGDDWCMHALYERLLHDPKRFPEALSWLYKCVKAGNPTIGKHMSSDWSYIYYACLDYSSPDNEPFANLVTRCAIMTAMILTHFGKDDWETFNLERKKYRAQDLTNNICKILKIDVVKLSIEDTFKDWKGNPAADGLAYGYLRKIAIKTSSFLNYDRFITILFHELGHFVTYAIMEAKEPKRSDLLALYGLEESQIQKWKNREKGYIGSLSEEDPDTLSYGVWTIYHLLFS